MFVFWQYLTTGTTKEHVGRERLACMGRSVREDADCTTANWRSSPRMLPGTVQVAAEDQNDSSETHDDTCNFGCLK